MVELPKKQQQSLIPRYLLQYLESLQITHTDPTAPWGSIYTAGTGIAITDDTISVDSTVVALKSDLSDYVTSSELITELGNYVTSTDLAAELLNYAELSDLSTVATTGDYNDLLNKPSIPTKTSDLTNDSGFITSSALTGYATETWVTNQGYSTFSGSYNDLTNKPDLSIYELAADAFSGNYNDLINKPDLSIYELAADAFSGNYNDLTNKPTIPVVPTNVSAFTNDAGYITSSALTGYATESWVTNQGYALSTDIPTDYVDLTTDQNVDGVKTFLDRSIYSFERNTVTNTGSTNISFKETNQSSTRNIGALVAHHNRLRFNGDSASSELYFTAISDMGYAQESYAGFYVAGDTLYDKLFVAPHPSYSAGWDSAYPDNVYYIPMVISDGTTNYYANEQGIVTIPAGGGSSYTAGTGIDITNDVISIDSTVVALKSDIPTVPTNVSSFTNDAGYITNSVNNLTNYFDKTTIQNMLYDTTDTIPVENVDPVDFPTAQTQTLTNLYVPSIDTIYTVSGGGGGSYESNLYLHKINLVFTNGSTFILRGELITEYPDEILTFTELKRQLDSIVDTQFGGTSGYTYHQFNGVFMRISSTVSFSVSGAEYVIGIKYDKTYQQIDLIEMGYITNTSTYNTFSSSYNPNQNYRTLSDINGTANATYTKDVVLPFIKTSS